jgi:hypothetical protein
MPESLNTKNSTGLAYNGAARRRFAARRVGAVFAFSKFSLKFKNSVYSKLS